MRKDSENIEIPNPKSQTLNPEIIEIPNRRDLELARAQHLWACRVGGSARVQGLPHEVFASM